MFSECVCIYVNTRARGDAPRGPHFEGRMRGVAPDTNQKQLNARRMAKTLKTLKRQRKIGPNMLRILPRVGGWTTLWLPKTGSTWIDLKNYFYSLIQKAM